MTKPKLFQAMSRDEAIASFRGWRRPVSYCRDQFIVCGKSILFFATLTGPDKNARLLSPDILEWWPTEPEEYLGEKVRWFPDAVQPKYSQRSKAWEKRCYLFFRQTNHWLYCGSIHQAYHQYTSIGHFDEKSHVGYHLEVRLPYDTWVALGGFPAWKAKISGTKQLLGLSDSAALDAALAALPAGEAHAELTRWQGDTLSVFLNEDRGLLMYLTGPGDNGIYVVGEESDEPERFSCPCCGIELEFERKLTVSRAVALDLFREYFVKGVAPKVGEAWMPGLTWERDV